MNRPMDIRPHGHGQAPCPRRQWIRNPLRWLIGGVWCLWHWPLQGLVYGMVFVIVASLWAGIAATPTAAGIALAASLTAATLMLAPRLTAGLICETRATREPVTCAAAQRAEERAIGLTGIGLALVLVLSVATVSLLVCFALLYSGEVPALALLPARAFSWQNATLVAAMVVVGCIAVLVMQLIAVVPTFVLTEWDTDLAGALRLSRALIGCSWRSLAGWALFAQLLLLAGAALTPLALLLLAPVTAFATWWACHDAAALAPQVQNPSLRIR